MDADGAELSWSISLIISLLITALVVFLGSLFFVGGPYTVPNFYLDNSLRHSWWGIRPLCPEKSPKFELKIELKEKLEKAKKPVVKDDDISLNS